MNSDLNASVKISKRFGVPATLVLGFLAVLLFMTGDGVETNFLSILFVQMGFEKASAASIIAWYGITVAIGSGLAGIFSAWKGPRFTMLLGAGIWIIFELIFLLIALPSNDYTLIAISYGLRGFGYPLFAFGFLIWISYVAPLSSRGTAVGWFWASYSAGFPMLGSLIASGSVPIIGEINTLWLSLAIVIVGSLIALLALTDKSGKEGLSKNSLGPIKQFNESIKCVFQFPKVGIAAIVRMINTTPQIGFFVLLPFFFTDVIGFSVSDFLLIVFVIYIVCMISCLFMGKLGDKIGWRKTVFWVGCIGGALSTLATYYGPMLIGNNLIGCMIICAFFGVALAGFVPLAALMPTLQGKSHDDGTILTVYCLSAGISVFIGPAIVSAFMPTLGIEGLIWIFASMYLIGAILTHFLRTDLDPGEDYRTKKLTSNMIKEQSNEPV